MTRSWNLFIVVIAQVLTAYYLLGIGWEGIVTVKFILLIISTSSIAAGGYVINDYYDIKIDMINKPERVVIGKNMERRTALALHFFLNTAAIIVGWSLSWKIGLIHVFSSVLLWAYSNQLKRMPLVGNLAVAFLSAMTLYVVAAFYGVHNWGLYLYMSFAFFFSLWRETIKDIEDRLGDESFGCRTLPIVYGVPNTKKVIYVIMLVFALSLLVLNFPYENSLKLIYILSIITGEMILAIIIFRADTITDFRRASAINKFIMFLGVLSMIITPQIS